MSIHCLCSVMTGLLSVISNRVSVHCVSSMFVSSDHWLCSLCSGIIGCVHCPYLCPLVFVFFLFSSSSSSFFLSFIVLCFVCVLCLCSLIIFTVVTGRIHCVRSLVMFIACVHCL